MSCDGAHDGVTDREVGEGGFLFEVTHGDVSVVPSRALSRDTVKYYRRVTRFREPSRDTF